MNDNQPEHPTARPRVLVGVDGSEDGLRAVMYAMREARASGHDVWVVHVVDDKAMVSGLWDLLYTQEDLRQLGQAKVTEALGLLAEEGFPSERVTSEVLVGPPGQVLAEQSEKAAMMVVGRRSVRGLERMFVGSTSVSVAALARCPVIVISGAVTPQETGHLRVVAVAVNSGPSNVPALAWGFREASLRKARLRVVHVVPEAFAAGATGPSAMAAATAKLDEQLAPFRKENKDVTVEVEFLLGTPVNELVGVSKVVDLLIMGVRPTDGALGGAVRGVMAHAHCPVGLAK